MGEIMTVTGPIPADKLETTLMHEHLLLDLTRGGAGRNGLLNNQDLAYEELMRYKDAGGVTLVDQTSGGIRESDHDILPVKHALAIRGIADRTGLNIILGTGWYREPFYEKRLYRMKTDQIAEELVRDITEGIDGTDVKAGYLGEIGAHFTWVSPVEERVFRAVARAHNMTGLTIGTHSANWSTGLDQLDILEEEGVDPRRVVIGHCHNWPSHEYHTEVARRGAFTEFDRLGTTVEFEHKLQLKNIKQLIDAGYLDHLLFSQDVCTRTDYVAYGGKGYSYVVTGLRNDLAAIGITDEQFHQITVVNPRRALTGEG